MSAETLQFKTELKQLLHLIVHSLYSHKDIFLRELISNASDACDTARFRGLTHPELLEGDEDWKIKLTADPEAGTLTISDNGVGMTREQVVENLGTIARSGTRAFLESLKEAEAKDRPDLIGQFGVGFYSAFMVADRVTVVSRGAGSPAEEAVRWASDGQGEFSIESATRAHRGTDVILHLKEQDKDFLDPWRLRQLVKKYSDFVAHPIVMDVEREDEAKNPTKQEETLNSRQAIWLRPRGQATTEEYNAFYGHLSHDTEPPAKVIHYIAEGAVEFKALLYLPARQPHDLFWNEKPRGLQLYIQRVFIMDDSETLLPRYLRFVKGVVDSPDLPLNVSRELLQQSAPLETIRTNLVNKVLGTLEEMKTKEPEAFEKFHDEFSTPLKEGVAHDWSNRERLAGLLRFETTKTERGKATYLADYVERMPSDQQEIFYLLGEGRELLEQSPHLEAYRASGHEVLLLTDPVDEFMVQGLPSFKDKRLKAVDRGGATEVASDKKERFTPLLDYLKGKVGDVADVRLSSRLKESAACLVAEEHALSANMERLLRRMGHDDVPTSKKVLELNPDHAAVEALRALHARNADDARVLQYGQLLYDQALIAEGAKVHDPLAFARRVNELLIKDAAT